jgi:gliding motility-associated-like protein
MFIAIPQVSFTQYSVTQCQTVGEALIATDRNDWAHANLPVVNEGYLHNFDPPELPCGINNPSVLSLLISIDITNLTSSNSCPGIPLFGNVLQNCSLTDNSVCTIIQDVLTPGCNTFGGGATTTGTYSLDIASCNSISATDTIGVDIIPATDYSASCPSNGMAISDGSVAVVYEICLTYIYDQAEPAPCSNTISLPCDDNNPCTINDFLTVDECNTTIVCAPCQGTPLDCDTGTTSTIVCDDGNACTINDIQIILDCDGSICVPCQGIPLDCDTGSTSTVACDDGDACTINDIQIILDCDGSICAPCQGIPLDCDTGSTSTVACDDGNPCTINDVQTILDCNGSVCVPCQGIPLDCNTGSTSTVACDDGDVCTINDLQTVLDCDGSICSPCQGTTTPDCDTGTSSPVACDDGNPCTVNDVQMVLDCDNSICIPCQGELLDCESGEAIVQPCDDGDANTINDIETILVCDGSICIPCQGEASQEIYIPNIFSPNNDGVNDLFNIYAGPQGALIRSFKVFNRWGALVFSADNFEAGDNGPGWDGTYLGQAVKPGVYVYFVDVEFKNGMVEKYSGEVVVVR